MKDLDIQIAEEGMRLLKGFIGQEFISMKHEKMGEYRDVFRQVMIETSNGRYLINNDVEGYADYFGGIDALPHLDFLLVKDGQDPFDYASDDEFSTEEVMETVLDVQVIRDHAEVLNGETHRQYMDASEGIIIITDKQQYGFFKDSIWFEETMYIWQGQNVLDKIEDLQSHWNIFGYPYNAKVERFLVSLKTGVEQKIGEVEEHGVAGKEEANN